MHCSVSITNHPSCQASSIHPIFRVPGAQMFRCVQLFVTPWTLAHQAPLAYGISQARILEWVAIFSSRKSSWSRDWTYSLSYDRHYSKHWRTWGEEEAGTDLVGGQTSLAKSVLVSSGYYNKNTIDWIVSTTNLYFSQFWKPESPKSRSRDPMSGCVLKWPRKRSSFLSKKKRSHLWVHHSYDPITTKIPASKYHHIRDLGFNINLGGDIHSSSVANEYLSQAHRR